MLYVEYKILKIHAIIRDDHFPDFSTWHIKARASRRLTFRTWGAPVITEELPLHPNLYGFDNKTFLEAPHKEFEEACLCCGSYHLAQWNWSQMTDEQKGRVVELIRLSKNTKGIKITYKEEEYRQLRPTSCRGVSLP